MDSSIVYFIICDRRINWNCIIEYYSYYSSRYLLCSKEASKLFHKKLIVIETDKLGIVKLEGNERGCVVASGTLHVASEDSINNNDPLIKFSLNFDALDFLV